MTPLSVITYTTDEITVCTTEAAKDANKVARNPPYFFFISCFTASVNPSINTSKSSNNFTILIISSISSFEMNNVNPFPALTACLPLILLSNLFIPFEAALEAILLTNPGNLFLAKETARSVTTFLPNLFNQEPKNPPDSIILVFELY